MKKNLKNAGKRLETTKKNTLNALMVAGNSILGTELNPVSFVSIPVSEDFYPRRKSQEEVLFEKEEEALQEALQESSLDSFLEEAEALFEALFSFALELVEADYADERTQELLLCRMRSLSEAVMTVKLVGQALDGLTVEAA